MHVQLRYSSVFYVIQARDILSAENVELHEQLQEPKVRVHALQQHLEVIRGHTIGFILEQMNTLRVETKESQLRIIYNIYLYYVRILYILTHFTKLLYVIVYVFCFIYFPEFPL